MAMVPWRKKSEWDPFRELETLHDRMNQLFDLSLSRAPESEKNLPGELDWVPALDVKEERDRIIVKAELPGLKKEDVNISLEDNTLVINGEKKHEEKKEDKGYYYRECSYGSFQRAVNLPAKVKDEKVDASYKDGVLRITLPKAQETKTKQIDIK
ncbi:MAG: Hsp20/alpha crystallin family protein [Elusimicrobiota bacterium]